MSLLPPSLLQRLSRSRLQAALSLAQGGVGERRSRGKGAGIEFAEHREYQPGDDIRYLDRHVYSRLGQHVIKQYSLYQQLQVTVLLDRSASMGFGTPLKLRRAAQLAGVLAYVGLTGGDRVQVGAFSTGGIEWYPRLDAARRAPGLLAWLDALRAEGASDLARVAQASVPRLRAAGALIVVSDWLDEAVEEALSLWRNTGQELVGVQLFAPEELEPQLLGDGPVRLLDLESGQEVEVALDDEGFARYRDGLAAWQERLRETFYSQQGRLFPTRSDDDLEKIVLTEWRVKRLIS